MSQAKTTAIYPIHQPNFAWNKFSEWSLYSRALLSHHSQEHRDPWPPTSNLSWNTAKWLMGRGLSSWFGRILQVWEGVNWQQYIVIYLKRWPSIQRLYILEETNALRWLNSALTVAGDAWICLVSTKMITAVRPEKSKIEIIDDVHGWNCTVQIAWKIKPNTWLLSTIFA